MTTPSKIFASVATKFFAVASSILILAIATIPATSQAQDVIVDANAQAIIRQGILPVKIVSNDANVAALVNYALGLHGAFDVHGNPKIAAVISVQNKDGALYATASGAGKAFSGEISVSGTTSADVAELCDKIVVAVGQTYGWNLKPIFAKTKIAFSSNRTGTREIYFSDLLFRDIKQATNHNRSAIMPHWAPDGDRLFYTTYHASGAADVYSVDLKSGRFERFATYPNSNTGGAVSPDGKNVALALSARGIMSLYVKSIDGGTARQVSKDREVQNSPTWSPDGATIVFVSGPDGRPSLYSVPASGGAKTRLATGFSYSADPAWSIAAPTKIAFSYSQGGRSGIAVFDTATRKTTDVCDNLRERKISKPAWCADGRHIVAIEESGKRSRIVLLDSEGGDRPKCTPISPSTLKDCYDPDTLVLR